MLTGFGLNDFRLLFEVESSDWIRDAISAYDLLAAFAENVSVVGHSTGGTLGVYVASHRPVHHLILSGPNLYNSASDKKFKRLGEIPVLSDLITWLLPVFTKPIRPGRITCSDTLEPEGALNACSYKSLPTKSLLAMWKLQDMVDISHASFKELTLIYGEQDLTVGNDSLVKELKKKQITFEQYSYANSGHNVMQDYDKHAATEKILEVLSSPSGK